MMRAPTALLTVLTASCIAFRCGAAQPGRDGRSGQRAGELSQNVPNPPKPDTRITFTVGDHPRCGDDREYKVSLRIYNVLAQLYAVPVLQLAGDRGPALDGVRLKCGEYTAYWNGKQRTGREDAAPGVYRYSLEIDGRVVATRTMTVSK
ncbi:MAG TPA: hypothetical protein VJR92_01860 [Gemmatimonadaceae bacterium]|nr:hypothetical protein [Gemmatimonadaceae bacterium]